MVLMPSAAKGEENTCVTPTNAEVRLVDDPKADPIFVALDGVRMGHPEQGDVTWTGKSRRRTLSE